MSRRNGHNQVFSGSRAVPESVPPARGGERAEKQGIEAWLARREAGYVPRQLGSPRRGIAFGRKAGEARA